MRTADLIAQLADEAPTPQVRAGPVLAAWAGTAFVVCLLLMVLVYGAPLVSFAPEASGALLAKLAFPLGLALAGGVALRAAGMPGRSFRLPVFAFTAIFAATIMVVGIELAEIAPAWPGGTWARCLTTILLLTPVVFLASCLALRRLAPTRLRATGALAGLFSASTGATAYAMWCPETTATFLLAWYGGPILLAGLAGAAIGPRVLRW